MPYLAVPLGDLMKLYELAIAWRKAEVCHATLVLLGEPIAVAEDKKLNTVRELRTFVDTLRKRS